MCGKCKSTVTDNSNCRLPGYEKEGTNSVQHWVNDFSQSRADNSDNGNCPILGGRK